MAKETPTDQETAAWVVDQLQVTKRLSGLYEARFGTENPYDSQMTEALDGLGLDDLARIAGGKPLRNGEGSELAAAIEEWGDEEKLRALGARAFGSFWERQNAAIAERLRGKLLVVTRLEGTTPGAISTHPQDGLAPLEGPVDMVFRDVRSQDGRIGLGIRQQSGQMLGGGGPIPKLVPEVYAYVLGRGNKQQLDLQIKGTAGKQ